MKTCKKCHVEKSLVEFSKHVRHKDGLNTWCRECVRIQNKEYRKHNDDDTRAENKKQRLARRENPPPTKSCPKCKIEKLRSEFVMDVHAASGLKSACKICHRAETRSYVSRNPDKAKESYKKWALANPDGVAKWGRENPEKVRALAAAWRMNNPDKVKFMSKRHYDENKDVLLEKTKVWRKNNREKLNEYRRNYVNKYPEKKHASDTRYRLLNPEKSRKNCANWRKRNRPKLTAKAARRRSSQLKRTPVWLTRNHLLQIEDIYVNAMVLRELTNEEWHVDHMVPLQGKTVSGLHVPWNLQIIPALENIKKQNKYWPDMWENK